MLLPDTMELRVCVPYNSRSTAWASFDGRGRVELKQGDHIKVTASKYPFPTVCADKQSTDWFHSISRTLKWNERERQKSFVVVEETSAPKRHNTENGQAVAEEDDEEEEEKFDIDDSSGTTETASSSSTSSTSGVVTPAEPSPRTAASAIAKGIPGADMHVYTEQGTESPDRFGPGRRPVPPRLSPRHAAEREFRAMGENGDRDNIHSPRAAHLGARSRIPRDRDVETENMRTPRAFETARTASREGARRAFAVWGQDESDSNASDSESN